jgi:hypothetical protein
LLLQCFSAAGVFFFSFFGVLAVVCCLWGCLLGGGAFLVSKTAFALALVFVFFGRCRGGPEQGAGGVERSDHDPEASCAGPVSGGW